MREQPLEEETIKAGKPADLTLTAAQVGQNEDIITGYFRILGGRTIYSSCSYCSGATGRRVRLDRLEATSGGLRQFIRDVVPETKLEVWVDYGGSFQAATLDAQLGLIAEALARG